MHFLKSKALFQIAVIIMSVFSVYLLNTRPVSAQSQPSNACCEKTTSGEYCQYTSRDQCDSSFGSFPGRCDQAAFCKPVCCIDTSGGNCYNNVPAALCASTTNRTYFDGTCRSTPACQSGCCQIGNQCMLTNERNCNFRTRELHAESNFDSSITNELQCVNQCRRLDEGCCITREGCTFETRGQCSTAGATRNDGTSGFYKDIFCSDPSLNCRECLARDRKGCLAGDDDVYWFDSCGNKEGKAEDCDYAHGTLCKEKGGTASCKSVNCDDTVDFPKNTHDPRIGGPRKNGESWCAYEGRVGPSYDLVGSRHYRHLCINSEELTEPCKDYREEMCLQFFVDNEDFSSAACVKSEGVNCVECNKGRDMPGNKRCCKDKPSCFWSGNNLGGKCLPVVPPGLAFWSNPTGGKTPGSDAKEVCDYGDTTCKSIWVKKMSGWKCVANCDCEEDKWVNQANSFCRSLGDCGAHYNIIGEFSNEGQRAYGKRTGHFDKNLLEPWSFFEESGNLLMINVTQAYQDFASGGLAGSLNILEEYLGSPVAGFLTGAVIGTIVAIELSLTMTVTTALGVVSVLDALVGILGTIGAALGSTGVGIVIVVIIAILTYTIFKLIGIGETKKYTHNFDCEPWVAPKGGGNCDKCDDDPRFECTEYRCRSLGAACQFVNEGTKQAACVNAHPNDVSPPVIQPSRQAISRGFTINPTSTGYQISPMVPAFSRISFGVSLNEHAQCKFAENHTASYEEMTSFFGNTLYEREKNVTMNFMGGRDYTFYLRCSDFIGNANINEYTIQLSTSREPDLTAPRVEETSIQNNAFVPYGVNETVVTFYLNEPGACKWSKLDQDYETMPENNTMICNEPGEGIPLYLETYDCDALLPVHDDTDNKYYIRCIDLANNINQQSYDYTLKGTKPLTIQSAEPSGVITTNSVNLRVVTANGAEQGKSTCGFIGTDVPRRVEFVSTGTTTHMQPLNLTYGSYRYIVDCNDVAGNEANATIMFDVQLPLPGTGPRVVNIYSRSSSSLTVITDKPSTCRYSKTQRMFTFDDGILMSGPNTREHSLDEASYVYYVQCKDDQNNISEVITIYR